MVHKFCAFQLAAVFTSYTSKKTEAEAETLHARWRRKLQGWDWECRSEGGCNATTDSEAHLCKKEHAANAKERIRYRAKKARCDGDLVDLCPAYEVTINLQTQN